MIFLDRYFGVFDSDFRASPPSVCLVMECPPGPLKLVHCDFAGPVDPVSIDGYRYALSFTDDYSGLIMTYFLKQKSDTAEATKKFLSDVSPFGKVKCL